MACAQAALLTLQDADRDPWPAFMRAARGGVGADTLAVAVIAHARERRFLRWIATDGVLAGDPAWSGTWEVEAWESLGDLRAPIRCAWPGRLLAEFSALGEPVCEAMIVRCGEPPGATLLLCACLHGDARHLPESAGATLQRLADLALAVWRIVSERAEQRAREAHLQQVIDASSQIPFVLDAEARLVDVDRRGLALLGCTLAELRGGAWTRWVPPADRRRMRTRWTEALATGVEYVVEHRLRCADGSYRWMRSRARPHVRGDGMIDAWFGTSEDVHDRRHWEEALRASEARYRALLAHLPGAAAFVVDRSLRYVTAEGTALAQAGTSAAAFVGRTILESVSPRVGPARAARYAEALAGQPFEELHDDDGRSYLTRGVPLSDADGQVQHVLAISVDVTAQRATERELREGREHLRLALRAARAGGWAWSAAGGRATWSDEVYGVLGFDREVPAAAPHEVFARIPGVDRERVRAAWQRSVGAGGTFEVEFAWQRPLDGASVWIACHASVEHADGGVVARGVFQDVTVRVRAQKDLEAATQALADRARTLETVLASVQDFIYLLDLQGRFVFANQCLLDFWGKTSSEIVGRTLVDLGYETSAHDVLMRGIASVTSTGTSYRDTARRPGLDGVWREFDNLLSPIFGPGGVIDLVAGASRDVTERLATQRELARSEARFRAAQETSVDGFMMFESVRDASGAIVDFVCRYANAAAARLTGAPESGFVGTRMLTVMPDNRRHGLFDGYVRVVESGEPWTTRFRYAAAGREVHIRISAAKVDDGLAVSFADLTPEHEAEERLRASERRFSELANSVPALIWVADAHGRTLYVNRTWREYAGEIGEPAVVFDWTSAVHPDDAMLVRERWGAAVRTGDAFDADYRLRGRDGTYRWFKGRGVPQRDAAGCVERWYCTCTDVDAAKVIEQVLRDQELQLREADRRKDVFLATLAHELRNPLAPVRTAAALVARADLPREAAVRAGAIIERQVRTMSILLEDLLDASRISRGKLTLRLEDVDLDAVLDAAIETSQPWIAARRHELVIRRAQPPVVIRADPVRLAQVLVNLLNNAAKYMDDGGRIELTVGAVPEWITIAVRDHGIGLEAAALDRVFDLFAQVASTDDRSAGGLGIGLALAQGLARLHGGRIEVSSDGLGHGSEFRVVLPRGRERQPVEGTRAPQ